MMNRWWAQLVDPKTDIDDSLLRPYLDDVVKVLFVPVLDHAGEDNPPV